MCTNLDMYLPYKYGLSWIHPQLFFNPPASKACREVENLTEIKNPRTHVNGFKEFFCMSVTNFDLNYFWTGRMEVQYLYDK